MGRPETGARDGLGIAGRDLDLGADAALALADLLGDVGGEALGPQGLAEDDGVDGLVDDLLEAGHVDAGLLRVEVDEAFEVGVVEGLVAGLAAVLGAADADDLLDADDADAGEADSGGGGLGLGVAAGGKRLLGGIAHLIKYAEVVVRERSNPKVGRTFGGCMPILDPRDLLDSWIGEWIERPVGQGRRKKGFGDYSPGSGGRGPGVRGER